MLLRCFQWFKDTNLKANHNYSKIHQIIIQVVSNGSKILIWKQITTCVLLYIAYKSCFQWFKDTNLKANHNISLNVLKFFWVVSNGSKILIWKQITTKFWQASSVICCFQWFKDTNLKANHNTVSNSSGLTLVVSNGSKILIWKQITTTTKLENLPI